MATTGIRSASRPSVSGKSFIAPPGRSSVRLVWLVLALAVIAAIAYALLQPDTENITQNMARYSAPAHDSSELTPSVTQPGSPDTTTSESTFVPSEGID